MSEMSLNEIAEGKLQELFEANFQKVIDNIYDPNTKAKVKRQLIITLTLNPDDERESVEMDLEAKVKLAAIKGISTRLLIGYDHEEKKVCAAEYDKRALKGQMKIDSDTGEILENNLGNTNVLSFKTN